jgi:hypothetical protein
MDKLLLGKLETLKISKDTSKKIVQDLIGIIKENHLSLNQTNIIFDLVKDELNNKSLWI